MSTTGHENEVVRVSGLKATMRKGGNLGIPNKAACSTAAATAAKTITLKEGFALVTDAMIVVTFTNGISVAGATLAITYTDTSGIQKTTAAKAIYYRGAALGADLVKAGDSVVLRYDGSHFEVIGQLTPLSLPASDVAPWAKANGKPTYSFTEIEGQVSLPQLNTFITGVLTPDYYTKDQVNTLLVGIEQFEVLRVDTLPTASAATTNKMYIAPTGTGGANEVWITAKEEQSSTVVYAWAKLDLLDTYSKAEIDAMIGTATKTPVVVQTNTAVAIEPNKLNVWSSPVPSLSISFQQGTSGIVNEYMIRFTCPSNAATEISLPSGLMWAGGQELEPEPGYTYQISVIDNLAIYAEWEAPTV